MAQSVIALGFASGAAMWQETALGATVEQLKAASGTLYQIQVDNTANGGAASYLKIWDNTSGSVTIGTTAPDWIFKVPGGAVVNHLHVGGVALATGLCIACVTAGGTAGTTPPTSSVIVRVVYS